MSGLVIIGMIVTFVAGLWCIAVGLMAIISPFSSPSRADVIFGLLSIALGGCFWYYVFSHLHIGIG